MQKLETTYSTQISETTHLARQIGLRFLSIGDPRTFRLGVEHVSRADPKIRRLVKKVGLIEFEAGRDSFESLVEAIISQQLNGKAARSIFSKLKTIVRSEIIDAQVLNKTPASALRRAGVSPQKSRYLKDLSSKVVKGKLDLDSLRMKRDEEVVRILDEAKGIGPWTAQMFLLFTLGRSDVLPVDDLGIQMAIRKVYSLRKLPSAEKIERIASKWHPYCSVASLYLWESNDSE